MRMMRPAVGDGVGWGGGGGFRVMNEGDGLIRER